MTISVVKVQYWRINTYKTLIKIISLDEFLTHVKHYKTLTKVDQVEVILGITQICSENFIEEYLYYCYYY